MTRGTLYKNLARCSNAIAIGLDCRERAGSTIIGLESWDDGKSWIPFEANEDLMKIELHWAHPEIWSLQDGYGTRGYTPTQGKDWSGVRDSSESAILAMSEVAERLQRGEPWPWEAAIMLDCSPTSCLTYLSRVRE